MPRKTITIRNAHQNNLRNLDLELPLGELIVLTGVSGSGKSSLAFDTVYAEGQRRYVETFSPYARQFLDRMDKPRVDGIEGIPPAIAIDQTNPVRTSRSTVGTMTELNDHLKLLFARAARLFCRRCGAEVRRDAPEDIASRLQTSPEARQAAGLLVTFPVAVPKNFTVAEVKTLLARQGYTRLHEEEKERLEVVQDRVRPGAEGRSRLVEALEAALNHEQRRATVYPLDRQRQTGKPWRFSADLHCADCELGYDESTANLFSFNSPVGACDSCRGFGRTMGVDYGLVIPDPSLALDEGAIKPWQSESYAECQDDLLRFARERGIPVDIPWQELPEEERRWVIDGEGRWSDGVWYGVQRFFDWLETKSYKMHIRVLLSRYRAYNRCDACQGARLKPHALLWRLGGHREADEVLPPSMRFRPAGLELSDTDLKELPGLTIHDLMLLPLERCRHFFAGLELPAPLDQATELLLANIRARLDYLVEVGLGYLALDRQSRTLSGGEVQRINLTTALGTSLVNTLFVLDEPSIGLHDRDMRRMIAILHRLRDAGNTLLVVEHDAQVMRAADRIIDLGPGPGEGGGRITFCGTPQQLLQSPDSLTAAYLRGERRVVPEGIGSEVPEDTEESWLEVLGAAAHNLKNIDVRFPLNRLVCVSGVSGSGKSTLVQGILYNALRKLKARPVDPPGAHLALRGDDLVADVTLVDQSPIGKTTRSNPVSYVGALDAIRKLFADAHLARERDYTAGTFSFNAGNGRCPECNGSGFEHVEMQFLSDVYLRCPECDGRRYRSEVLEVKLWPDDDGPPRSIADVLEMTVGAALAFFAGVEEVRRALGPLAAVGLDYLRLGQPVPTLSGGEAQRLKLAAHLVQTGGRKGAREGGKTLFLLDEPTTGLHFDDIATLLQAFRRLLAEGHSLVVIEHNLDVIAAADWVIDLGPEGGDGGGELVCAGPPREIARHRRSHTGRALRQRAQEAPAPSAPKAKGAASVEEERPDRVPPAEAIRIINAREHNLRGIDVELPRERFTVVTGISGSGKSTVAFDILFNEGQRRYLESLNAYARQFVQPASRAEVDAIDGIPPTVAIEQRTSRGGRKSTVATMTEIHHFLRLLFVKLGTSFCPRCDIPIDAQTPDTIAARLLETFRGRRIALLAPLVSARKGYYTDLAAWAAGKGYSHLRVDGLDMPTHDWPRLDRYREHDIDLPVGELTVSAAGEGSLRALLDKAIGLGRGLVKVCPRRASGAAKKKSNQEEQERIFNTRRACPRCGEGFGEPDPRLFSFNSRHGWCPRCFGTGLLLPEDDANDDDALASEQTGATSACPDCRGARLRPEALAVRFRGLNLADWTALTAAEAETALADLDLQERESAIARDLLPELRSRLRFLREVGLGYLALDRSAPTLSGGEAQRIRLAAQLGSNLSGVCYILDEPTIGLHPRDNRMLLDTLDKLEAKGNTIVVVEHDEETIRRAERVIDLGPGAGVRGGQVVAAGSFQDLIATPESVTGRFLADPLCHPLTKRRKTGADDPRLHIIRACLHNLAAIDVALPLQRLVCVTGVSGSGKSSLIRGVLHHNLKNRSTLSKNRPANDAQTSPSAKQSFYGCSAIAGVEAVDRVLEVDQTPIGKTPRSCPATYVGFWDDIRKLFAGTAEAKMRGYGPGRFSFNTREGRCPECDGQGMKKIEMNFLPDVRIRCEACNGRRFTAETLMVRFKGQDISEILAMDIDTATEFFRAHRKIHHALKLLQEVGLGYLTLGQQSPTLSGGEAQRLKLVTELAKAAPAAGRGNRLPTLYILDEPTIGLHMADVEKLIRVLHRLVEAGHSVVVIEHNLDVIAEADWLIDLGPEAGDAGGRLVAEGPPEKVARKRKGSITGPILRDFLARRKATSPPSGG